MADLSAYSVYGEPEGTVTLQHDRCGADVVTRGYLPVTDVLKVVTAHEREAHPRPKEPTGG